MDLTTAAFLAAQRADLLRFAAGSVCPEGFGWLDETGRVDPTRPVELWITCRMTHVAALGVLADERPAPDGPDRAALLALAEHGVGALVGPLRDREHGGWYAAVDATGPTVTTKQAYGHAFVVLAASSAVAAGVPGATALLDDALEVSLTRFWDEDEGLSVEEWDAAWTVLDPYRGVNANMHTVEAYLAAGDVTGDQAWHERAGRIAARVVAWAQANRWRIPEHFDADWSPELEYHRDQPAHPFRPFGATVGHGLEWARLLLAVEESLGADAPAELVDAAIALYQRAVSDGWHVDAAEGFVYTTDWDGRPVVRQRMHWVVAEAVNAATALARVTGEARYGAEVGLWWDYIRRHLIDPRGSWHHELDVTNAPAATVWPGKPDVYHAYQAAVLPELPLVPSFASALAQCGGLGTGEFLVVGESVLDVVTSPDTTSTAHPGGSPANVAVGLARLGGRVTLLTQLADDAAGRTIRSHLGSAGVTVLGDAPARTPVSRATLAPDGSATYDFDLSWSLAGTRDAVVAAAAHLHTGSVATLLLPGADEVRSLVERARRRATVSLDPNIRPGLVGDRADGVARLEHLVGLSDVVKASDEDLAWLYPDVTTRDVLTSWARRIPLVVVTRGAEGALACVRGEIVEIDPVQVEVADTVGAGDSFMAALLDGLAREGLLGPGGRERLADVDLPTVHAVVARAATAAALTVSRPGADPPTLGELVSRFSVRGSATPGAGGVVL